MTKKTKIFDRQIEALKAIDSMLDFCKKQKENGGCKECLLYHFTTGCEKDFRKAREVITLGIETDNLENISFKSRDEIVEKEQMKFMKHEKFCQQCESNRFGKCKAFACSTMAEIDRKLYNKYSTILNNKNLSKDLRFKATVICEETKYMAKHEL